MIKINLEVSRAIDLVRTALVEVEMGITGRVRGAAARIASLVGGSAYLAHLARVAFTAKSLPLV